jgi:uncharacterized protein (DUF1778 family)
MKNIISPRTPKTNWKTNHLGCPVINTRYDSEEQLDRFKQAAEMFHWSLNTFMLVAADLLANKIFRAKDKEAKTQVWLSVAKANLDKNGSRNNQ